jgi:hypothetical protein
LTLWGIPPFGGRKFAPKREKVLKTNSRIIICTHKDSLKLNLGIDFSEFWDGAPKIYKGTGSYNWSGSFQGRPELANSLIPSIQKIITGKKLPKIRGFLTPLRNFYRFLDAYENWCKASEICTYSTQIRRLEDIDTHLLQMWKTPSPNGEWKRVERDAYILICMTIKNAIQCAQLPPLIIPLYPRPPYINLKEIPDEKIGKLVVRVLASAARKIFDRWERADSLAASGRNLLSLNKQRPIKPDGTPGVGKHTLVVEGGVNEADLHTTYRAAVLANGNLPLSEKEFLRKFVASSTQKPKWWPQYPSEHPLSNTTFSLKDLRHGLYPESHDMAILLLLFMARSAWNQATVEELDISEENKWCKQYTDKLIWLFSYKPRSNAYQDTVSLVRNCTMPYQIIRQLLTRTAPLRQAMAADYSLCDNPELGQRSPWLFVANYSKNAKIYAGFGKSRGNDLVRTLREEIRAHNRANLDQIPESLTPSDLRDIFAGTIFQQEFSLLQVQLALGHKSIATTFLYLRRKAWRAESEQKKNTLLVALIDQIETHKVIDLTLLHAQMDGINVTREMIDKLERYRKYMTYSGIACSDPTHPPAFIDGTNPRDGTVSCAQQHLCVLCPKGRVFNDSLPFLARRFAELVWLRDSLPFEVFSESSLPAQLKVMTVTLTQWPSLDVEKYAAHWASLIETGQHLPIRFTGER